jgi:hypothetical protein
MFNESDSIFLLFTRGINICKEERDIVTAHKGHETSGIKLRSASLLFPTISGLMRILTLVDGGIWDFRVVGPRRPFPGVLDPISYSIHLFLRYKVVRVIKRRTVSRAGQVPMMEITVCCCMDVAATDIFDELRKLKKNKIRTF